MALSEDGKIYAANKIIAEDPSEFISTCCSLIGESGVMPFVLYPEQRRAVTEIGDNVLNIILKSRQVGMTWTSSAVALHRALYNEYEDIL